MTERRAHWSDDLIEAVFRIMDGYALEEYRGDRRHGTPTYDIIAAVEDWIDARGSAIDGREVVAAIAAIARVRERAGGPTPAVHGDWMAGYAAAMRDILSALDGTA